MHIEPLDLSHQSVLEPRFRKLGLHISEYSFANAYLFRHDHAFQVVFSDEIYLRGKTREGFLYLMPTALIDPSNQQDVDICLQGCDFLFPIPESWLERFDPQKYQIDKKDHDSDYLYTVHKLSDFPGRQLSGRRNLVRQFNDLHPNHASTPLTAINKDEAIQVLEGWRKHGHENISFTDYSPCLEALQLMDTLNLSGRISHVDGHPAGFVLGEELNSKIFVIHFAKALKSYKGIYQYIYQEFAHALEGKYEAINLEQDLGAADLQHAKRAYYPDQLISKLRISLWKSKTS
jgi:hypothetical protein